MSTEALAKVDRGIPSFSHVVKVVNNLPTQYIASEDVAIMDMDSPAELFVELAPGAQVQYISVIGLQQCRKRVHFKLRAGSSLEVTTVVLGTSEPVAVEYVVEHRGNTSRARVLVKGVFAGGASANVSGLIVIPRGVSGVDSFLEQRALLLSPESKVNLRPGLKIEANDVKAGHAATIGEVDPAQLFYCQSRGIPLASARQLIAQAFLKEVLMHMPDDKLRDEISITLTQKFLALTQ